MGRRLTFRQKLLIGFSLAIVVVFAIGGTSTYLLIRAQLVSQAGHQLDSAARGIHLMTRTLVANSIRNYLKGRAETNLRYAEYAYNRFTAGLITEEQARADVEAFLLSQKVGSSGYMTAVDISQSPDRITLAVHPKAKGADITGDEFAQQMARQLNGYQEFLWQNPGDPAPRMKSQWMAYFQPWDWIINVAPYLDEYRHLIDISGVREEVAKVKVGEAGYALIMDMQGNLLMHPQWQGRNVMHMVDPISGREFVREIIATIRAHALSGDPDSISGTVAYHIADPDSGVVYERLLNYRYLPDVDWILAVVVGADEIERPLTVVRNGLIAVVSASVALAALVVFWLTRPVFASISALTHAARQMEAGRLDVPLPNAGTDEIGVLTQAFANMAAKLKDYTEGLERAVEARTAALRDSETTLRKFKAAVDHSSASIIITDRDARIEYVNSTFTAITGYGEAEAIGSTPRLFQSGQTSPETYRALWETILAGQGWRGEFLNKRKDGSLVWEDSAIAPVFDGTGAITNFVAVNADVTERHLLMEELTNARNRAEEGARAKSAFLATMSHEIRTPMNAVMGYCHLLADTPLDGEQRKHLAGVTLAAETLLRIIDDILDFSKIEAGRLELEASPFDPARVVREVVDVLAVRARQKGIVLEGWVAPDLPAILVGDRHRLAQVLLNLVGNAVKFTESGKVSVALRFAGTLPDGRVEVSAAVTDSGIGLSPEQMERLFQPFSQADSSTTRRFGGTGLGLTICARLVEMMDGQIWAESQPGKGSIFHFTARFAPGPAMPEGRSEERASRQAPAEYLDAVRGAVVLLAEDNPVNRQVATQFLRRWGMVVRSAENGQAALDIVEAEGCEAADIVLMDMHMPIMDGCEATRRIRKLPGLDCLPIIALTANALPEERQKCIDAGMNDYLSKPFDPAIFLATLARWRGN